MFGAALLCALIASGPVPARAQSVQSLQEHIQNLEKQLNALKDQLKAIQEEQKAQKAKVEKQEKALAPLADVKKTVEALSKIEISGGATGTVQATSGAPRALGGDEVVLVHRFSRSDLPGEMPWKYYVCANLRDLATETLPEAIMAAKRARSRVPLPRGWRSHLKSAALHAISLARFSILHAYGAAANHAQRRVRLAAQAERLREECARLREEIRVKDARMGRIPPQRRPHYSPLERMAILELRAARGWSLKQTAAAFLLTPETVALWSARIEEEALVQLPEPVNRFPDFVRYLVQRLKALCPTMGKVRIADTLCRARLHLGATTIGRILREERLPEPECDDESPGTVVIAKHPNHVWHVDLTVIPTSSGFWTSWPPFSLPQDWPFCWWVAVVLDQYSRCVLGVGVFKSCPTSSAVQSILDRVIGKARTKPKHLICDKGKQFLCESFKEWCRKKRIRPRFGAVGKRGSIAVVERFIGSLKSECMDLIPVPFRERAFCRELMVYANWYNQHRPHSALRARTPAEVYGGVEPGSSSPRIEPRAKWPVDAPYASPQAPVAGEPGTVVRLRFSYHAGRKHPPVVALERAA